MGFTGTIELCLSMKSDFGVTALVFTQAKTSLSSSEPVLLMVGNFITALGFVLVTLHLFSFQ